MANLIVTFTKAAVSRVTQLQVARGSAARTEQITIGVNTAGDGYVGLLSAAADEDIVELYAEGDCWVTIGADPEATAGAGRFLPSGDRRELGVDEGDKIAVIAV